MESAGSTRQTELTARITIVIFVGAWLVPVPQYRTSTFGYLERILAITAGIRGFIGTELSVNECTLSSWEQSTLYERLHPKGASDLLITGMLAPSVVGDLQDEPDEGRLWDISFLAQSDVLVDYSSIHPYYKRASLYNGNTLTLTLPMQRASLYNGNTLTLTLPMQRASLYNSNTLTLTLPMQRASLYNSSTLTLTLPMQRASLYNGNTLTLTLPMQRASLYNGNTLTLLMQRASLYNGKVPLTPTLTLPMQRASLYNGKVPLTPTLTLPMQRASLYNGKVTTLPADGSMLMLYYNKDSLGRANVKAPATLAEVQTKGTRQGLYFDPATCQQLLTSVAVHTKGTRQGLYFDPATCQQLLTSVAVQTRGTRQGLHIDPATCQQLLTSVAVQTRGTRQGLHIDPATCQQLLTSVAVQTKGTRQGLYIDPPTGKHLLTSVAMHEAVRVLHTLRQYSAPPSDEFGCTTHSKAFALARCAMTIGPTRQWKIPGSSVVSDRKADKLVAGTWSSRWSTPMMDVPMINVAPFPGPGGTAFAISAPKNNSLAAYSTFSIASFISSPALSISSIMSNNLDVGPFRNSHFSAESLRMLIASGYNEQETTDYLQTMKSSLEHPNSVAYFISPGATLLSIGLRDATNMVIRGDPSIPYTKLVQSVIGHVSTSVRPFEKDFFGASAARLVEVYSKEIGYKAPPPPAPAPPAPTALAVTSINSKHSLPTGAVIGIIIGSIVALVALSLALWRWLRIRKKKNTSIPGVSPSTTILVTDIQDSTTLWEELPAAVMNEVLHTHHECIRQQLLHFGGYESATEGDSFIVAFHTPADALDFAISAQTALLEADWPSALLDSPFGAQVLAYTAYPANDIPLLASRKQTKTEQLEGSSPSGAVALGANAAGLIISGLGRLRFNGFTLTLQNSLVVQKTEGGTSSSADTSKLNRISIFTAGSFGGNREPSSSASINLSAPETPTLQSALARTEQSGSEAPLESGSNPVFVYRGLRVRMGFHCGVTQATEVAMNPVTNRLAYSGAPMAMAKPPSISFKNESSPPTTTNTTTTNTITMTTGAGGMVTLTQAALDQLQELEQPSQLKLPPIIWSLGQFTVKEGMPPIKMYQAFNSRFMPRVVGIPPLRALQMHRPGVLSAPIGNLAIVTTTMVGYASLCAWDIEEAAMALNVFQDSCHKFATRFGGFMAYAPPGGAVAAFSSPCAAANWALNLMDMMLHHDWSESLLTHETCEELYANNMCAIDGRGPTRSANGGISNPNSIFASAATNRISPHLDLCTQDTPRALMSVRSISVGSAEDRDGLSRSVTLMCTTGDEEIQPFGNPPQCLSQAKTLAGLHSSAHTCSANLSSADPSSANPSSEDPSVSTQLPSFQKCSVSAVLPTGDYEQCSVTQSKSMPFVRQSLPSQISQTFVKLARLKTNDSEGGMTSSSGANSSHHSNGKYNVNSILPDPYSSSPPSTRDVQNGRGYSSRLSIPTYPWHKVSSQLRSVLLLNSEPGSWLNSELAQVKLSAAGLFNRVPVSASPSGSYNRNRQKPQAVKIELDESCRDELIRGTSELGKDILVARGPRLQFGITFGYVRTELPIKVGHGEAQYRGKVASQALSLASSAHPNEVG
eukprot:gene17620-23958_t